MAQRHKLHGDGGGAAKSLRVEPSRLERAAALIDGAVVHGPSVTAAPP